jgi:MazG family protein
MTTNQASGASQDRGGLHPELVAAARALDRLLEVLRRLRAPDGCPWDREQTVASLSPYLLEESYEALDAIQAGRDRDAVEELGDVLMNVLMIPMAGSSEGRMSLEEVADGISAKLVRRHPHVFGDRTVAGVEEVWKNWETIKAAEKRAKAEDDSALAGIPRSLPALLRALRTIEKSRRAGFRYTDLDGPIAKIDEEWAELRAELKHDNRARIEEELGDLLFSVCVLASHLSVNPELALRGRIEEFSARFRRVERELGDDLKDAPLERLREAWRRAKAAGAPGGE